MSDGGELVLVFDDGYRADYDEVLPVLRDHDAPACFAVVPEWLDEPEHLAVDQLDELAAAGCEVVAHGRRHRRLQSVGLAADAAAGDERVHVGGPVFPDEDHGVLPGDEYELIDGATAETRRLAGTGEDDEGEFVELERPLETAFAAGETAIRPTADVIVDEVRGAGEDLRELGFEPRTFALPYDAADARAWTAVERHYDALVNVATRSLPNPPGTPATNLRRYYLETDAMSRPELETYLDAVADRGGVGVLGGHSAWETVTPGRVRWVLQAARERGVEVTTAERLLEDGVLE